MLDYCAQPEQLSEKSREGSTVDQKTAEEEAAENQQVADLMAQLTTEEVKDIMNSAFEEMLGGLKVLCGP